jgi:hypothetical protein
LLGICAADVNLRTADSLSMKFFFLDSNQDDPFLGASVPGCPVLRAFQNRNLAITETHIFSPRAITESGSQPREFLTIVAKQCRYCYRR